MNHRTIRLPQFAAAGLLALATGSATAQSPVIGTDAFFQVGAAYLRDVHDVTPALEQALQAAVGPDYLLDLAPLSSAFLYTTDSLSCINAPGNYIFFPDYFDTANVALQLFDALGNDALYLFLHQADRIQYVGGAPNGSFNEIVWQQFPDLRFTLELEEGIAYGHAHTDTVEGYFLDASGSDGHYVRGYRSTVADGYGSILMPDGTLVPQTLRMRSVITATDSNGFFGVNPIQDTLYTWYAEGVDGPLMTWGHNSALYAGYIGSARELLTVYRRSPGTGLSVPVAGMAAPSVVPDPTTGPVLIRMGAADRPCTVRLLDASGRELQRWAGATGSVQADLSGHAPGLYVVLIERDGYRWLRTVRIIP